MYANVFADLHFEDFLQPGHIPEELNMTIIVLIYIKMEEGTTARIIMALVSRTLVKNYMLQF
jgi:hypothetical protein